AETEKLLAFKLRRFPLSECDPRPDVSKHGHIGVFPQKQPGLNYTGVVFPVGRITSDQMRGLSKISEQFGSGTIRLTVWQNLLITDIPDGKLEAAKSAILELGLTFSASSVRGGLVACTGAAGCKYAMAHTKTHAMEIANYLDERIELTQP